MIYVDWYVTLEELCDDPKTDTEKKKCRDCDSKKYWHSTKFDSQLYGRLFEKSLGNFTDISLTSLEQKEVQALQGPTPL